MASFRVLFFVFSVFLWGRACSAPVPVPDYTPVLGEIVRIKPSDTDGPQVGVGAAQHHYYIAVGPHATDPNRHMVAAVTHSAVQSGLLGPAITLPASGLGSIPGLTGDVLLSPTSAHVQHISPPSHQQVHGVVGQEWIDSYHSMQERIQQVNQGRARARTANLGAANAHSEAHRIHNEAAHHAEAGQHRAEHATQAAHHLAEANRHNAIAEEQKHDIIRPINTKQHLSDAKQSFRSAESSKSSAAQSSQHAEAALRHMMAAGVHRHADEAHRFTASTFNSAIYPSQVTDHTSQANSHANHVTEHRQSAAAHSPSQQLHAPDPTNSRNEAENSRHRAANSLHAAKSASKGPAPPRH